jgi:hypothetical protein
VVIVGRGNTSAKGWRKEAMGTDRGHEVAVLYLTRGEADINGKTHNEAVPAGKEERTAVDGAEGKEPVPSFPKRAVRKAASPIG